MAQNLFICTPFMQFIALKTDESMLDFHQMLNEELMSIIWEKQNRLKDSVRGNCFLQRMLALDSRLVNVKNIGNPEQERNN